MSAFPPKTSPSLAIALAHAAQGRRVFPAILGAPDAKGHRTKTPLVPWKDQATCDPDAARKLWRQHRDANLAGWALDEGTVALDVDDPAIFGSAGLDLPLTASQQTPSGGYHFVYATDGRPVRQTVKEIPGADTRVGLKGWLGLYGDDSFADRPVVAAPAFLYGTERPEREASDDGAEEMGSREEILHWLGKLARASAQTEAEYLALLKAARDGGRIVDLDPDRPWKDSHLRDLAREAARWETVATPAQEAFAREALAGLERWKARRRPKDGPGQNLGIDAVDLLAMDIPPLVWVVEGLISAGTTILAAEPKIGKSWLAYQACVEVALGGKLLERDVMKGSALYYALEDGERRGQSRLRTTLKGRSFGRGALEVRFGAPRIGKGLEEELNEWLDSQPDARLVVIDTLQKVRPPQSGRRGSYEVDVEDLGAVQDVFRDRPVALLIVHHTRKLQSDDFLATVSGTYGITGSADSIITLKRRRLEAEGKLDVTSRDGPEDEFGVRFDGSGWTASSKPAGASSLDSLVWDWLREHGQPAFANEIATSIKRDRLSVQRVLKEMYEDGALDKGADGYTPRAPTRRRAPGT